MSGDLKACPFCGGHNLHHVGGDTYFSRRVMCGDCGNHGLDGADDALAAVAWNTRDALVEADDGMVTIERAAAETAAMLIRADLAHLAGLRLHNPAHRDLDKACVDGMELLGVFEAALKAGEQ